MSELVLTNKIITSLILAVVAFALRWLLIKLVRGRPEDEQKTRKRRISRINNGFRFIVAIGLMIIWLLELKYLALSIAAFAVALVLATREYIQCLLGSLYQMSIKMFVIGDWIQVSNYTGEVVQSDWFTTTLMEIDVSNNSFSYTGKTLTLPNNLLLTNTVTNFNFMRRYLSHSFSIIRDADSGNLFEFKEKMLERANAYCQPFNEIAHRYNSFIETKLGVQIEGPEPIIRITTNSLGKNQLNITIFCPTGEAVNIEQKLTEDFMRMWYQALADKAKLKAEQKEQVMAG